MGDYIQENRNIHKPTPIPSVIKFEATFITAEEVQQLQQKQEPMPMLKVSVPHYRDKARDEETWTKWYLEEQIPRFVPIAQKHGIDRVELAMAPYDAATIYWVTDPQKIRNMLNEPIWMDKVTPSEKGWIDQNKVDVQAGQQTTFVEDGKVINTITKSYD
ncbi:hypothetical protein SCUP515_06419 [Seiridium cupressi]